MKDRTEIFFNKSFRAVGKAGKDCQSNGKRTYSVWGVPESLSRQSKYMRLCLSTGFSVWYKEGLQKGLMCKMPLKIKQKRAAPTIIMDCTGLNTDAIAGL